jgi:hypothetical protein
VVAKHRKPEGEPWLASVSAPAHTAEFGPEAAGYGRAAPRAVHAGAAPAGHGYPASKGYDGAAAEPGWAAAPEGHYRQERQEPRDWRDWGPPPVLPPDHPSGPIPRVQFPADQLSRRIPAPRPPWAPTGYSRPAGPPWQETTDYRHETASSGPGPRPVPRRLQNGRFPSRNSVGAAWQVPTPADAQAPPTAQQAQDYAAAIREAAEREAAALTQDATNRADAITRQAADQTAAIREAAGREAAAIHAAAQLDADALRSAVTTMSVELGRVKSVLDDILTAPRTAPSTSAPPAETSPAAAAPTAPPEEAEPAGYAAPADYAGAGGYATSHALPQRAAGKPTARPGSRPPRGASAAPDDDASPEGTPSTSGYAAPGRHDAPAAPTALRKPPGKSGAHTRQYTAARRFATGAATLAAFGLLLGAFNLIAYHNLSFFVFRGQGVGATPPSPLPAQPNGIPSPTHRHSTGAGDKHPRAAGHHHRRVHDQSTPGGSRG